MTKMFAKWNYPTTVRFGAGRIKELPDALRLRRHQAAALRHRSRPGEAAGRRLDAEDPRRRQGALRRLLRRQGQPGRVEPRPPASPPSRRASMTASSPSAAARRSTSASYRLPGRPDAPGLGFRGHRRLVDARQLRRHRADRRRADHRRHRLRGRPRRRPDQRGDAHQEDHLPSEAAAGDRHRRSGTHRRHAALHHRRHRHGRARPLPRSLFGARLSSDGRRHRARRHAPRLREPAQGRRQRQGHRPPAPT